MFNPLAFIVTFIRFYVLLFINFVGEKIWSRIQGTSDDPRGSTYQEMHLYRQMFLSFRLVTSDIVLRLKVEVYYIRRI